MALAAMLGSFSGHSMGEVSSILDTMTEQASTLSFETLQSLNPKTLRL